VTMAAFPRKRAEPGVTCGLCIASLMIISPFAHVGRQGGVWEKVGPLCDIRARVDQVFVRHWAPYYRCSISHAVTESAVMVASVLSWAALADIGPHATDVRSRLLDTGLRSGRGCLTNKPLHRDRVADGKRLLQ
jgi:hypothetical protein